MRAAAVATAIGLSFIGLATASDADASIKTTTNIPAQRLGPALESLAKVLDLQVLYRTDVVGELMTRGASGAATPDEALTQLLEDTGLTFQYLGEKAVTIVALSTSPSERGDSPSTRGIPAPGAAGKAEGSKGKGFWNRLRIAQAESSSSAEEQKTSPGSPKNPEQRIELEEILVTGSRLMQRPGETTAPTITFDRERIKQIGANSIADVMRYLPQQPFANAEVNTFANAQAIQLRGLGLGTTLVLINGRRTVTSALQGARSFFDVNVIPVTAVDRVEVLSSSASAVYGSDALGGVVNIILKEDIERPELEAYYGYTPDGDNEEKRASLSAGLDTGRWHGAFTLDYFDRLPLFGASRDVTANADFRRFGSVDRRSQTANPGNVFSTSTANLPGLTTTFAGVPRGSSGVGLQPADFAATAGVLNLGTTSRFQSIIPQSRRATAIASTGFDFSEHISAFGEVLYVDREDVTTFAPASISNVLVPVSNPFNPFGVPVRVNYLLEGLGPRRQVSQSEFYRVTAGLKGSVGSWRWELSGLTTHDDAQDRPVRGLNNAAVAAALAATDPAQALNPFQHGPGGSDALLQSLYAAQIRNRYKSVSEQIGSYFSGPLFTLTSAGPVEAAIGAEAREEGIVFDTATTQLDVDRATRTVYGEVRVPLIGPDMSVPLVRDFMLSAAGHYDHYSDFGNTFNPEFGLRWTVVEGLTLRASWGTSFRAPSLFELYAPQTRTSQSQTVIDPRRNNDQYLADLLRGGNPDLDPEEADSFSAGIVLEPQWLPRLRLSVDYFQIQQDLRVQQFGPVIVLTNEALFPDRIVRGAPTAQDLAAGLPGRIVSINATTNNFGAVDTHGIDLDVTYDIDSAVGRFRPSLMATYLASFRDALTPGGAPIERAGLANQNGSYPVWKVSTGVAWSHRGAQASITGRYVGSYDDVTFFNVPTGRKVDSQFITDMQVGFSFGEVSGHADQWFDGLTVRVGASNIFDESPPFSQAWDLGAIAYDPTQAELRQRFLYINLSNSF